MIILVEVFVDIMMQNLNSDIQKIMSLRNIVLGVKWN